MLHFQAQPGINLNFLPCQRQPKAMLSLFLDLKRLPNLIFPTGPSSAYGALFLMPTVLSRPGANQLKKIAVGLMKNKGREGEQKKKNVQDFAKGRKNVA